MAQSTFSVEIKGLKEMEAAFKKSPKDAEEIFQQAIVKAAAILAENTDSNTVPFKTGNLIRSFNPVDIGKLFARWYPRAHYAPYVQFGTRRGLRPRKYMEAIVSKSKRKINELFGNALKAFVNKVANP